MNKNQSYSSLSSFEDEQEGKKIVITKQVIDSKDRKYNYSANNFGIKRIEKNQCKKQYSPYLHKEQIIKKDVQSLRRYEQIDQFVKQDLLFIKMKQEILLLQKQNSRLAFHNIRLAQQIQKLKEQNTRIETRFIAQYSFQQKFIQLQKQLQSYKQKQIQRLKQKQNQYLIMLKQKQNDKLKQFQYQRQRQRQRQKQREKERQKQKQKQKQTEKQQQRLKNLYKQMEKIKSNVKKLKIESQKDKITILNLQQQIKKYEQEKPQLQWKNKFLYFFIDMVLQITDGIEPSWPQKKKIHIGWKLVKNLIHKALQAGIKPAKVQKSQK